jgi:hypothetical protein
MILLNYKLEFKCIDPITDTFVIMINLITIAKLEAGLNFDTEAAFKKYGEIEIKAHKKIKFMISFV